MTSQLRAYRGDVTPLVRIRRGALVLLSIVVLSACGYRLAGLSWLDAVYMVVITISSVGYTEVGPVSDQARVLSIFVIIFGMSATAYTIGGLIQLLFEGEVRDFLEQSRMSKQIHQLKNHIVICGYGRIGSILAEELSNRGRVFVIIDNDPDHIAEADEDGHLVIHGDATEEDVLIEAGISQASTVVIGLPGDADNVFITLTCRNLNPDLHLIARGESRSTEKKLLQAGADRVVLPSTIGAMHMVKMITRPSAVELIEGIGGRAGGAEITEWDVPDTSPLVGNSLATVAKKEARLGIVVVAVKRADGEVMVAPSGDFEFRTGDTVIVLGQRDSIERFERENRI